MNLLALRDYPAFRQWVQVVSAAVLAALVSYDWVTSSQAELWAALVVAVLPPTLSVLNSADGKRSVLYGVIAAVQALVIAYDLATADQVEPIVNIILAAVGGSVAVTHTPTPSAVQGPVTATPPA